MSRNVVVGWHGACDDGHAAAWSVRQVIGDAEFYPCVYQKEPPDWTGRDVILVDFCYKRPVIDRLISQVRSLLILDHHKTAAEDLAGLPAAGVSWHEWSQRLRLENNLPWVGVLFDMDRSGAGIAWDFFNNRAHSGERRPEFIDYIEDRDLWRKSLPEGDQFTIALRSYPQDFDVWDTLVARGTQPLIEQGRAIWRYYRKICDDILKEAYVSAISGIGCWMVNAPYFAASEVAGDLGERVQLPLTPEEPCFGGSYFQRTDGMWQYSLRSRSDFDVSDIARRFGGGGHAKAAGFASPEPVHEMPRSDLEAAGAGGFK